jgi:hypothetical protein
MSLTPDVHRWPQARTMYACAQTPQIGSAGRTASISSEPTRGGRPEDRSRALQPARIAWPDNRHILRIQPTAVVTQEIMEPGRDSGRTPKA